MHDASDVEWIINNECFDVEILVFPVQWIKF